MTDFSKINFISSYEIARECDVVYSELVTTEEFNNLQLSNYYIISNIDGQIFYKLKSVQLNENDTIFTNLSCVKSLFKLLNKVNLKNIKLITAQSDEPINYELFKSKPECISEWFSVNINIDHPQLRAFPLGLSNSYSKKIYLKDIFYNTVKKIKLLKKKIYFILIFK